MKKVDFDDYAASYDELLRKDTGFFSDDDLFFAEYKVRVASERVGQGAAKILEYGCGIGRNFPFLRKYFPSAELEGTDMSRKSLEVAERMNPDSRFFPSGDASTVGKRYDLVFVAGVFHHVAAEERHGIFSALRGHLGEKGRIVIFEQNPYNPVTRRIVDNCPYDADAVLVSMPELKRLARDCGFRVIMQGYSLFFPKWLGALSRMDRLLRWFPLGGQYYIIVTI